MAIARALNLPLISAKAPRQIGDIVLRELRKRETRVLILLEFDNLEPIGEQERSISFDCIKDFTESGISVVIVGTEKSVQMIAGDDEMATRFRPLWLTGFAKNQEFKDFLNTLETFYPFSAPSNLAGKFIQIHNKTKGVIGEVVILVNEAAAWAARNTSDCITDEAFEKCRYIPPAQRGGK